MGILDKARELASKEVHTEEGRDLQRELENLDHIAAEVQRVTNELRIFQEEEKRRMAEILEVAEKAIDAEEKWTAN